jgi:hypothetical protein
MRFQPQNTVLLIHAEENTRITHLDDLEAIPEQNDPLGRKGE